VTWQAPNLAREPFENRRPARRLALILGSLALALTAWNVGTWWRIGAGAAERAHELERLTAATAAARERIGTLESDLAATDLERANDEAAFLNERIDERVFSWNRLLDDLVEALPPGVRLRQLSPKREGGQTTTRGARTRRKVAADLEERDVELRIRGEAEDDEALLELVDRLFSHPAFRDPDLQNESRSSTGELSFDLSVAYRPDRPAAATEGP
jgi:Tfp pilus assembly protein PilN